MFVRKLSRRSKAFVVLAVACGALAFQVAHGYASELAALRPVTGDPVGVVVAADDLSRGTVLADDDVRVERVPTAFAPPGAFAAVDGVIGRTLVSDVASGEAVTATRVAVAGGPIASLVPSGLRAFAIRAFVPPGSVTAGDLVDVVATFGGPHPYSDTVGTGLEVLSAGDTGDGAIAANGDGSVALVLLVTPDTAERLAYATAYADLAVSIAPPASPAP